MTTEPAGTRFLTVVVCGAGPATEVATLVALAEQRGWSVDIIATPAGCTFLDVPTLEALTNSPVRSEYRASPSGVTRSLSNPDGIIVAPATYNTICKLAIGVSDTYALGTLAESIGRGLPVVILPFVNSALASRKPFSEAVRSLRDEGVCVMLGENEWLPHPPGTGGERIASFPWSAALDQVEAAISASRAGTSPAFD